MKSLCAISNVNTMLQTVSRSTTRLAAPIRPISSSYQLHAQQTKRTMPTTVAADNGRAEQETVKKGNVKTSPKMGKKTLTLDTMNPHIKVMEYAVRGPIVIRAGELEMELKKGAKKPYKEIIRANIGDCHATGQVPITYIRNVLTLCINPKLLDSPDFAPDVKEHAKRILSSTRGGLGSYTDSTGLDVVRQDVADFIKRRDGIAADPDNIILTAGASEGIKALLKLINNEKMDKKPGVMVPIPQYPLYSATIAEYGMEQIGYYLDEDNNWALDINELKRSIREARKVCHPSVIVIINPGNPTGQVLTEENIRGIIKFAHEEGLYIMADEVYQDNVYAPGNVAFGGAYMELVNMDSQVMAMLKKMLSAKLCPTSVGQACIGCVVSPPKQGDPSYESFMSEKQAVLKSLAEKAKLVTDTFNSIPGIHCNTVQGAMYAFPRLDLPQGLIDKAKSVGQDPDFYYALQLLENTGICIVPGSGFGQKPGTHHFRTTILPPPKQMEEMMVRFKKFHTELMEDKLKNV